MAIDRERLLDVLDRAHAGPIHEQFDWDTRVIPATISARLKKYGLERTCDPNNPVNQDLELADRYFQAAMEVALETGMYCTNTHRALRFSREELMAGLEAAPSEFTLGEGKEVVRFRHRGLGDSTPPVWVAPLSIAASERVFVPLVEGIAGVEEVDCLEGPSLEAVWGRELRAGTPYELLAGKLQADLFYPAIKRAGREGIGLFAVATSPTHYGVLGGYGITGGYKPERDIVMCLNQVEIKTSYETLFKLCQVYNCGGKNVAGSWSMIGGYAGGPEGATLSCIACTILLFNVFQCALGGSFPYDLQTMGNCGRRALWGMSIVMQALSRNTHVCISSVVNQTAGPATSMLLQETAVGMTVVSACGASSCSGTRSAGGRLTDYITPLEVKFAGEVFKRSAGMSLDQANHVANQLLPKYEGMLGAAPQGKSFTDCYDISTLSPSKEWLSIYEAAREEAARAGIPLN